MLRDFFLKLKGSILGPLLVKAGIRRWTFARKIYGVLIKTNTKDPIRADKDIRLFIDEVDTLGLLKNPSFYENNYEAEIMKKFVNKGDVVVDVGANIGGYTLFLAKLVGKTGKVYAFEPDLINFQILLKNIKLNGFKNIIPIRKAISNTTGKSNLYLSEWNNGDHRIYSSDEKRKFVEIEAVRLDDYFKSNDKKINFVKMDIQGAEVLAFEGGKSFFRSNNPVVLQEFWPAGINASGKDYKSFLNSLASEYKIYGEESTISTRSELTPREVLSFVSVKKRNHANLLCIPKAK